MQEGLYTPTLGKCLLNISHTSSYPYLAYKLMLQDYFNKLEMGSLALLTGSLACNVLKDLTLTSTS